MEQITCTNNIMQSSERFFYGTETRCFIFFGPPVNLIASYYISTSYIHKHVCASALAIPYLEHVTLFIKPINVMMMMIL